MSHRLTQGHLTRHYQGAKGGRDAALLDIAQDFALRHLHDEGLFERGLAFKGGTALRKFRAGSAGRFSTDLDFSAPDEDIALEALADVDIDGFRFRVTIVGADGRRGDLRVETPFGTPSVGAKLELSRHELALPAEVLEPVRARYVFLRDLTADELRWCVCNPRERYEVEQALLGVD